MTARLVRLAPVLAALTPHAGGQQPSELRPLPARVEPVGEAATAFRTRHFEITSDVPLERGLVERFAQVVDTVPAAIARLPLPLLAPPRGRLPRIEVLSDDDAYERAGAAPGTSGFYDGRQPRLLVRRAALLEPPLEAASRLGPRPDQDLLVHELGHLCMHGYLGRTPQWFAEGACEYLACLHQRDGRFVFRNVEGAIRDHLRSRFDPANPRLPLVPLASITGLAGDDWLERVARMPREQRYRPYAASLLLFHYHLHGGAPRREQLRDRLEHSLRSRRPAISWLEPAEIPAIEEALTRYWKPLGLDLEFPAH